MKFRTGACVVAAMILSAPLAARAPDDTGQRVKMTPVGAGEAFDEFAKVCMKAYPGLSQTHRAVQRSAFGYQAGDGPTSEQWRSGRAIVGLDIVGGVVARCNLDAILKDPIKPGDFAGFVTDRLARREGIVAQTRVGPASVDWEWNENGARRVITLDFAGSPRQFSMSIAGSRPGT